MNWYIGVLKKYAVFTGRARRTEFWMFVLFSFIISLILGAIDNFVGTVIGANVGVLGTIYGLAVLIPSLAVGVRRLHDTNRTGWWWLIGLIPLIGAIILIVFFAQDSQSGDNQHGPNPKGV
jgi:uncharacterized membrane protein YhaH (DUF805 family)